MAKVRFGSSSRPGRHLSMSHTMSKYPSTNTMGPKKNAPKDKISKKTGHSGKGLRSYGKRVSK